MQDRYHQIIIALFTLSQFVILIIFGYTPYPDSNGYILLGQECAQYAEPYPLASHLHEYAFLWNMGAINAVALCMYVFKSIVPLLILYSLMKGATAWFLYHITKQLSNAQVAVIALLLYALYPANYGEATSVQSELPFIFFAMMAVWLAVNKKSFIIAGILLAVANYIRPFSLIFLLSLIILLITQWKSTLKLMASYVLTISIIGTFSYLRTGLFLYQAKTGWMALMQYSWDNSKDHSVFSINPETICSDTTLNVSQKDAAWRQMFLEWLPQNKMEYLRQMPAKLVRTYVSDNINMCAFLSDKPNRNYLYEELNMNALRSSFPHYNTVQWLTIVNLLYYYLLLITALLSLRYFKRYEYTLPLCILFIGTMMLLLVGHGEARFHQPFMPFIIILSALFLYHRIHNKSHLSTF